MCVIRPLTFTVIWTMFSNFSPFPFYFHLFLIYFFQWRLSDQNFLQKKEEVIYIHTNH